MSAVPASRLLQMGVLGYLLLFSFISFTSSVRVDFTEHWNKAAKIKVNPRGNLWATGHFMGKKSISGPSHLESPEDAAISSVPMAFSPSLRAILEDMKELLTRELLKILLQDRLLDENQGKHDLADQPLKADRCSYHHVIVGYSIRVKFTPGHGAQEMGLLMKVLEKYLSN